MKKNVVLYAAAAIAAILFISCSSGPGAAGPAGVDVAAVEFQNGAAPHAGYDGSEDAGYDSQQAAFNYGGHTYGWIGNDTYKWRYAVRFDVSSIVPKNVKVKSCQLIVYCNDIAGATVIRPYALNQPWTEGTSDYAGMTTGVNISWLNYDGNTFPWATAGGDFAAAAAGSAVTTSTSGRYYTFNINASVVQAWIDDDSSNNGLVLKGDEETTGIKWMRVATNESANKLLRPKLVVRYSLP